MWLATTLGFFSATVSPDDRSKFQIRARERGDLEGLCGCLGIGAPVLETRNADYRYRIIVEPEMFTTILTELARGIDYTNFKDAVKHTEGQAHKVGAYTRVWQIMREFQPGAEPPAKDPWDPFALSSKEEHYETPGSRKKNPEAIKNPKARKPRQALAPLQKAVAKLVCPECQGNHHFSACPTR